MSGKLKKISIVPIDFKVELILKNAKIDFQFNNVFLSDAWAAIFFLMLDSTLLNLLSCVHLEIRLNWDEA